MLRPAHEVLTETHSSEFKNTAGFMDEVDVRENYQKKPEQRDAILANAKTIECPVRRVKLYAIPDYTASVTNVNLGV